MAVRSGALNLLHKNSLKQQIADIEKAMRHGDVLNLSEVNHPEEIRQWAEAHGYGYIASKGKGDTGILYDASRYDVREHGSHTLNHTEGHNPGLRSREAAYALLVDKKTGKAFWQISAHTVPPGHGDPKVTSQIRQEQYHALAHLAHRLHGEGHPVLLAGDMTKPGGGPSIKGFDGFTSAGPMHTLGMDASAVDVQKLGKDALNSDHGAVFTHYNLDGGGNDTVDLRGAAGHQGGDGNGPKGGGHDGHGGGGNDPHIHRQVMATQYGFALAFMNSSPELKHLFDQAVKNTWTPDKFIAKLRDTKWFKHHSANVRNAIMQETSDPATYEANVKQMFSTVKDTWGSLFGSATMDHKQMMAWAETAHRMGWSEAQLVDHMASSLNYRKMLRQNELGGKAAEVKGQLDQLSAQYGVDLGNRWKAHQLDKLMGGNDTIGSVQQRVKDLAMREYKAFADRIAGGETVMDIADPYIQKMADLLEMNPNDVGLNNKLIQQALKQTTKDGKPAAMDLHTFADLVRKDPRWQYTDNAREQVNSLTAGLLQDFGLIAG